MSGMASRPRTMTVQSERSNSSSSNSPDRKSASSRSSRRPREEWLVRPRPKGGTPIADMGKLLQDHGIAVDTYTNATVKDLASELAQGHKVIVAVNAEDLWKFDPALAGKVEASGSQTADHAVVISGIDTSDPNDPKALISDPGTGEALASYPLNDFLTAWKTSDFFHGRDQDCSAKLVAGNGQLRLCHRSHSGGDGHALRRVPVASVLVGLRSHGA